MTQRRRPVISFATSKGGSGKSTCCIVLAGVLADQGGRVAIIDTDPTQTVYRWAQKDGRPKGIEVYSATSEDELLDAIDDASPKNHVILIDVEGRASVVGNMAMGKSSLVIVPVQPSEPDGHEAAKTIRAIKTAARAHERDIKFAAVMNRIAGAIRSNTYKDVVQQFASGGVPIAAHLVDREAYRRIFMEGGTIFTLESNSKSQVAQLKKARAEAYVFGEQIGRMVGLVDGGGGQAADETIAEAAVDTFRRAAMASLDTEDGEGETLDDLATSTMRDLETEASR
ncbi:ParA family protein [Acuticoccus sediminis]|nr:ParA family protein [Acuticoccus sediminis]